MKEMNKYRIILEKAKKEFGITDKIKILTKDMKTKAASISFKTRTIRINRLLVDNEDFVHYLIYHELTHYKLKTASHSSAFWELLYSNLGEDKVKKLERSIIRKILELNQIDYCQNNLNHASIKNK